jgi:omega-hydroxy-beta-dihydromenaquinone-9 sulfotransferase
MSVSAPQKPASAKTGPRPEWAPRIWQGCDFFAWLRILVRNRFAVHWSLLYIAMVVTFVSLGNTILRLVQQAVYGRRIRRTPITQPPIFILGHWRSGTTFLHELMIQDERFGYPTTYEALDPGHFLLTERYFVPLFRWLVPSRRPMDNMAAGFDRPQEDEFALCMMGVPSPYMTIAFPNHGPQFQEYLDFEGVPPRAVERWKLTLYRFLQQITYKTGKRLILKSPPHTGRIKVLQEMFPGARFVHIMRDPYVVYASTVKLWKTLYQLHGFQRPTFAGLEEYVFTTFLRMYAKLEEGRRLVDPARFFEIRYEELVRDPVGQMRALYEHFQLGGFGAYLPRLESYLATVKGYETNRYELTPEQRAKITQRWGEVIRRYGYG